MTPLISRAIIPADVPITCFRFSKSHLHTSFLLVLVFSCFTRCAPRPTPNARAEAPISTGPPSADTLYIPVHFNLGGTATVEDTLSNLPTQSYLMASLQGLSYFPLDTNLSYRGYDLGVLSLGSNKRGRLIRFEPSYNGYSALYLFLEDSQKITASIEVAFSMWEEGVQGTGSSFLVCHGAQTSLYLKQYWVNYYGSDAEASVSADHITPYLLSQDTIAISSMDTTQQEAWRLLFEQKEWQ